MYRIAGKLFSFKKHICLIDIVLIMQQQTTVSFAILAHRQLPAGQCWRWSCSHTQYNTKVPLFSDCLPWLSLSWSHISQCTNEDSLSYLVCWMLTIFPIFLNRQHMGYSSILQSYRAIYELETGTQRMRMPSGQNSRFCGVLMGLWNCVVGPKDVKCSYAHS